MIGGLTNTILEVLISIGYPGIAAVVGLESAGLPLPGETALFAASYLAATGQLSLPLIVVSAALGAVIGDSVGYFIGRRGGRLFLENYGRYVGITSEKLAKADGYFSRHGGKTVFFGRFIAVLRVLAGPLAGASNMPYRRFLAANVSGAVVWTSAIGTFGFFFGEPVAAFLGHLGLWAIVALAAFLVLRFAFKRTSGRWWARKRNGTQRPPAAKEPAPAAVRVR